MGRLSRTKKYNKLYIRRGFSGIFAMKHPWILEFRLEML